MGTCAKISQETSFRKGANKWQRRAQELVTALHAGGTGLALEMPHREKLLAELGELIWGFGWWGTDTIHVTVTLQQGPCLAVPQGTTVGKGTPSLS